MFQMSEVTPICFTCSNDRRRYPTLNMLQKWRINVDLCSFLRNKLLCETINLVSYIINDLLIVFKVVKY